MTKRSSLLLVAALPFLLLAIWRATDGSGLEADDHAQYLMHAEAVADGRSYTDIAYIYNPFNPYVGPRAEPPGLPLMVATVFVIFGKHLWIAQILLLGLGLSVVLLAGRYFAEHAHLTLGVTVAALCGLDPDFVHRSGHVFSDVPFCALIWATITLADSSGPWGMKRILGVTFLGGLAIAIRPVGVAILPALLLFAFVRRKDLGWRPAVPVAILGTAGMVMILALSLLTTGAASQVNWDTVFLYTVQNVGTLAMAVLESHLYPLPGNRLNDVYHLLGASVMLVGLGTWLRTGYRRFATLFAVSYLALFIVLPLTTRYLWPLFPFFVFGLLNGIRVIAERVRPQLSPAQTIRFAATIGGVIALMGVGRVVATDRQADLAELPDAQDLFTYLHGIESDAPVRLMFSGPRVMAWETGIPTMPPSEIPANILRELDLECITHLITQDLGVGQLANDAAQEAVDRTPEAFDLAHENPSFKVYRYLNASCEGP